MIYNGLLDTFINEIYSS